MTSTKQQEAMLNNPGFMKPPVEPAMVKFKRFLYNPETGAFLGRTGASWGE